MRKNLFDGLDIDPENTNIENGMAADEAKECARYDALLEQLPRDIQLLGLGSNGHIAFNEPGTPFSSGTHVVTLAESTVKDNARLFDDISEVPRKAFTMGIKQIMQAMRFVNRKKSCRLRLYSVRERASEKQRSLRRAGRYSSGCILSI